MKRKSSEVWLALRSRETEQRLTPLEAAMTPARMQKGYGTLGHVRRLFCFDDACRHARQRQKIWVR